MIFVTVGTHEQPFDRLIKKIDDLKKDGLIADDIIIQTGFSTYIPKYCVWQKLYSYETMKQYVSSARIVITHGGPSSFIMPLQLGKAPIVVPRQKSFGEHVNNHQVNFCEAVQSRYGNIILVEDIEKLQEAILNYDTIASSMAKGINNNNDKFCAELQKIMNDLLGDKI
jgi:UDP-N-acetylglucosamine transferase subunit ALG13